MEPRLYVSIPGENAPSPILLIWCPGLRRSRDCNSYVPPANRGRVAGVRLQCVWSRLFIVAACGLSVCWRCRVQRLPMTFGDATTTARVQWFMSAVCPTIRRISSPAHLTPVNAVEMLMNRSGQSVSHSCRLRHLRRHNWELLDKTSRLVQCSFLKPVCCIKTYTNL